MDFHQFKEKYQKSEEISHFPNNISKNPLVSVCVQTFQHENYIATCLNRILEQQTDFEFEILLGEDCSTDRTREICISYAEKFPSKIRLFLHTPENKIKVLGIPTGNFNAFYNFFSAKGEFIAFCEGDDYWNDPLKLQKQVEVVRNNNSCVLSFHSYSEVSDKEKSLPEELVLDQPVKDIRGDDLKHLIFHPLLSTICFRNFLRNEIPEEMVEVINVDSFLLSILGNYGDAIFLEDIKPSLYRRHQGGMWSGSVKEKRLKSKLFTIENLKKLYTRKKDHQTAKIFHKSRNGIYNQIILHYIKRGKIFPLFKSFFSKYNPQQIRL